MARFHIGNLPVGISKQELKEFLLEKSSNIDSLTVETIGRKGKHNKAFALVSCQHSQPNWSYLSYQGHALTILTAGGFGANSWSKPKAERQRNSGGTKNNTTPSTSPAADRDLTLDPNPDNNESSTFKIEKSMDILLAEYGTYDPNWQKQTVVDEPNPTEEKSCLGMHGKAPIHILCSSFGILHGIPNDRHELYYDCRELTECPNHLQFLDGQSVPVKRVLVNADARNMANAIAKDMEILLKESMDVYGYANPCQLRIYIASETGRHRSVVVAELAATALRKILRQGVAFACPVSVGCFHRDIAKRRNADKTTKRQEDDDDEREIKARRLPQRAVRW